MPRPCLSHLPLRQLTPSPLRLPPTPFLSIFHPYICHHTRSGKNTAPSIRPPSRRSYSSSRWKLRQGSDQFARTARVQGLKSRAAFKLLEIHSRHGIFSPKQTVVDLGYAPGSWSQVALDKTAPGGRVVGIDLIPAMPPRGVSTFQGDFLEERVRGMVKSFLKEGRKRDRSRPSGVGVGEKVKEEEGEVEVEEGERSYIDRERRETVNEGGEEEGGEAEERLVDVVLSDMSAPWPQTYGFHINSLSNPYRRMMNTSGIAFKDHAGSLDLCMAALTFASDTLKPGGHFVCKFYQGSEDKAFENLLKKMFAKVHREKPESSRSESREAYFVALRRKGDVTLGDIQSPE